ncbi:MAG TPA: hypothetical protein VGQ83_23680 [Polyangia bacterium]|jgi:hypothetical protein
MIRRLSLLTLALALGAAACGPRAAPAREGLELALVEELPAARLRALVCTYGGERRVSSVEPKKQRGRVVVVLEVEAPAAVSGLTLAAVELFDSSGGRLAYGVMPADLRLAPRFEPPQNPLETETRDFDGKVAPGASVRLWIHAKLDVSLQTLLDVTPAKFQVTLNVQDGRQVTVGGTVGEIWGG